MDQFVRLRVIDICTVFGGKSVEPDGVVNGRGNVDCTRRRRALVSREHECAATRRIAVNLNSNDTVDSIRYVDLVSFEHMFLEVRMPPAPTLDPFNESSRRGVVSLSRSDSGSEISDKLTGGTLEGWHRSLEACEPVGSS